MEAEFVSTAEQDRLERKMVVWANTYPGLPVDVVNYEFLAADRAGMALTGIQGTITEWDILGNYEAEYQFSLYARVKPGDSNDERLKTVELLNAFGDWAINQEPDLGDGLEAVSVMPTSRAAIIAAYENGDEDYQITMKLLYRREGF